MGLDWAQWGSIWSPKGGMLTIFVQFGKCVHGVQVRATTSNINNSSINSDQIP